MAGKKEPKKENKRDKKAADKEKIKKTKKAESAPKSKYRELTARAGPLTPRLDLKMLN